MKDVNQRFLEACSFIIESEIEKNITSIANKSGISKSFMTDLKKDRTNVGGVAIKKLSSKYPFINAAWLLTGDGEMISDKFLINSGIGVRITQALQSIPKAQTEIAEDLGFSSVQDMQNAVDSKFIEKSIVYSICSKYGFTPSWIIAGETGLPLPPDADIKQAERMDSVIKAIGKSASEISNDTGIRIDEVESTILTNNFSEEFVKQFAKSYGLRETWIRSGAGLPTENNPKGDFVLKKLGEFTEKKIAALTKEMNELENASWLLNAEMRQTIDMRKDSKTFGVLNPTQEMLERSSSISEQKALIEAERLKVNALVEKIDAATNAKKIEVYDNVGHTQFTRFGLEDFAIIVPFLYDFYLNMYPSKLGDAKFLESLPRTIFRTRAVSFKTDMRSIEIADTSMDNGSSKSILPGDIAIGTLWETYNTVFDEGTNGVVDFIIVTKSEVLCRNLKQIDRKAGTMTFSARNPDKSKYPDVTIAIDDIQEMYMIRRIERPKLEGVPAI